MQQWEYISIRGKSDSVLDNSGEEVAVQTYLTQMGRSGWELVAVTPVPGDSPHDPWYVYRLKRPRQQIEWATPQAEPMPHAVQKPVPQTLGADDEDDLEGAFAFGFGFHRR